MSDHHPPGRERPVDPARLASRWLVRSAGRVVGPVSLDQIERGLQAGRIPAQADMAHVDHRRWWPIGECFPYSDTALASDAGASAAPVPSPPPSLRYPEEPISIPKQGLLETFFG